MSNTNQTKPLDISAAVVEQLADIAAARSAARRRLNQHAQALGMATMGELEEIARSR